MAAVSKNSCLCEGTWVRFLKDPAVQQKEANERVYFVNQCVEKDGLVMYELIEVNGLQIYNWSYRTENLREIISAGRINLLSNEDVLKQFGKEKVDRIYLAAIRNLAGL